MRCYTSSVSAGFPLPGDAHHDSELDLNEYLIKHPGATYFLSVPDNSMRGSGIFAGDLLIVDRSLALKPGKIVIASIDGLTVIRHVVKINKRLVFLSEPCLGHQVEETDGHNQVIEGVVSTVLHFL